MLEDIIHITEKVFDEFIPNNLEVQSALSIYKTYESLKNIINDAYLVKDHYLALDFNEAFLQNSSWGEPSDKWRKFFNKDLEKLNSTCKSYLLKLNSICLNDEFSCINGSLLNNYYNCKTYYSFVRDEYNVGMVEPCGFMMISSTLIKTDKIDYEQYHISKFYKIDLSTYELRVELQYDLSKKIKKLVNKLESLKEYILKNYSIEDLL